MKLDTKALKTSFLPENIGSYDIDKAESAAYIARDCYFSDERHNDTLDILGFKNTQLFEDKHLQATLGCLDISTSQGIYTLFTVVFRGSDEVGDWLHNLDIRMSRFLPISDQIPEAKLLKVHRGFLAMVRDFEKSFDRIAFSDCFINGRLDQILNDQEKKSRSLFWLVGHSLGGAMATLFAARLTDYYAIPREHIAVYTFGAPPIANKHTASHYSGTFGKPETDSSKLPVFRIVNADDPVPGDRLDRKQEVDSGPLPHPPYKALGLYHFGEEKIFVPSRSKEFHIIYQKLSGSEYSNSSFDVHFMPAYLSGIEVLKREV
ncbi:MAG: lipase family protein [Acidobacteriota bacterium]